MKLKKLLASILALCMLLSTMSFNVFAEESTTLSYAQFNELVRSATDGVYDGNNITVVLKDSERSYQNNKTAQFFIGATGVNITDPVNAVKVSNVNFVFEDDDSANTYTSGELQVFANVIEFSSCTFEGVAVSPWGVSNDENPESATFKDCEWKDLSGRYGIHQNRASALTVKDCEFINCERGIHTNSSTVSSITITGNTFTGIGADYGVLCLAEGNGDLSNATLDISDNSAEGQVMLRQLSSTVTYEQVSEILDKTNNTYGTAYVGGSQEPEAPAETVVATVKGVEYTDIQEAFAAATEGDTIVLLSDVTPALTNPIAITKASTIDLGENTLTLTKADLRFGTTTFKNGKILVDPSVDASTAVFWMFENQTLTFDDVEIVATGVTGTYLIGINSGTGSKVNLVNGSKITIENDTTASLTAVICDNGTGNTVTIEDSTIDVKNVEGRFYLGGTNGNITIEDSTINANGVKEGFYLRAGQTLSIEGTSTVDVVLNDTNGRYGINITDETATYNKADTATVNASDNKPAPTPDVAKIGASQIDNNDPAETFIACEIFGLDKAPAITEIKVVTYSGGTVIATTTCQKPEYYSLSTLGVKICLTGTSSSWLTEWEDGMPRADFVPDKNVLYIDGNPEPVSEAEVRMITVNGEYSINWADVPGVKPAPVEAAGKLNAAYLDATYYTYGIPAFFGEATNLVWEKSLKVELLANGVKVGQTELNDPNKILIGKAPSTTWHAALTDDGDKWWNTTWEDGTVNVNAIPDTAKLYIDGTLVDECDIQLNETDLENPIFAAVTDENGKVLSFVAGTGYLNGQGSNVPVYTAALNAAVNKEGNATIVLLRDINTKRITIDKNNVTLDLNGKKITSDDQDFIFVVNKVEAEIKNGSLDGYKVMNVTGQAKVKVTDVEMTAKQYGVQVYGAEFEIGGDSSITATTETEKDNANCIRIYGTNNEYVTKVTVNGGTYTAFRYAIVGNGTYDGTEITIDDGSFKNTGDEGSVIFQPQNGTLTINGGEFEGPSAIYVKSGNLEITDGKFTATGDNNGYSPDNSDTIPEMGNAVTVETIGGNSGYAPVGEVSITGGTFTSRNGVAVGSYANTAQNSEAEPVTGFISGGTFNKAIDNSLCADGFKVKENGDGTFGVESVPVAQIGGKEYTTFEQAFAEVESGQTITLLENVTLTSRQTLDGKFTPNKEVTIEGEGKTITFNTGTSFGFAVLRGTKLILGKGLNVVTIGDTAAIYVQDGTVVTSANLTVDGEYAAIQGNGSCAGDVTINGGTIKSSKTAAIYWPQNGKLVIDGGDITGLTGVEIRAGSLEINGGTITATGEFSTRKEDDGMTVYGAAVVLSQHTTNHPTTVTINGGTLEGPKAFYQDRLITGDAPSTNISATIAAGVILDGDVEAAEEGFVLEGSKEAGYSLATVEITRVSTKEELKAALENAQDRAYILLTADIDYGTEGIAKITEAITLDLGGKTLTTKGTYHGLSLGNDGIVVTNGKLVHDGTVAAIKVWNAKEISNLEIDVTGTSGAGNTIDGIVIQENAAGVDVIKNVKIHSTDGQGVSSGIKTHNCGNATEPVIGSMENISVDAKDVGLNIYAPCGTATNCDIKGGVSGIEIWIKGTYSASLTLEDCTVSGGKQAVHAHDEYKPSAVNNGTITLTVDEETIFTSESGAMVSIENQHSSEINLPEALTENAVALVNGITYYNTLADALNAANDGDVVTLLTSVTLSEILTIDKAITLDGGENTLSSNAGRAINIECAGEVTIKNLTINGLEGCERGINIIQKAGITNIDNVTVSGVSHYAVNVAESAGSVKLNISESELTGYGALTIYGNGSEVKVTESDLVGINVYADNGSNGFATIIADGENITVTIEGGSVTAKSTEDTAHQGVIGSTGAKNLNAVLDTEIFTEGTASIMSMKLADNRLSFRAKYAEELTAEGYVMSTPDADGMIDVERINAKLCMDDDKYFNSFKDAFATLSGSDETVHTITLLDDLDVDVNYVWYKYPILVNGFKIDLDMNGKTITADWSKFSAGHEDISLIMVANGGELTIRGNGTIRNLNSEDVNTQARIFWLMNEGSTLTIENGTYIQEDDIHLLYTQGGPTYICINGGDFRMVGFGDFFNSYDGANHETVINGGTYNVNPDDPELSIGEDFAVKDNGNGTFGVVEDWRSGNVAYRAYVSASLGAVQIDLENIYAEESLVVELYDVNGELLTTTTYNGGGYDSKGGYMTCLVLLDGSASDAWTTVRSDVKLTVDNAPATIKLYADKKLIDTFENAMGDKIGEYKALDCVYKKATVANAEGKVFGYYGTLAEAVEVAKDGDTITLLDNVTEDVKFTAPAADAATLLAEEAGITLDLNEKTLNGAILPSTGDITIKNGSIVNNNSSYSAIEITGGKLTLENVNINSARHAVRIDGKDGAVVATINGGNYTLNATSGTRHAVNVSGVANVTIIDGTFIGPKGTTMDSGSAVCVQSDATVTIQGGNFSGGKNATLSVKGTISITGGTFDQDPFAYCAEGYTTEFMADGKYKVVEGSKDDRIYSNGGYSVKIPSGYIKPDTTIELEIIDPSEYTTTFQGFNATAVLRVTGTNSQIFTNKEKTTKDITVTIPYEKKAENSQIVVLHDGEQVSYADYKYDATEKTVTVNVAHFSDIVVYEINYTVDLTVDKTDVYNVDDQVIVTVSVAGGDYGAVDVNINFNDEYFEYQGRRVAGTNGNFVKKPIFEAVNGALTDVEFRVNSNYNVEFAFKVIQVLTDDKDREFDLENCDFTVRADVSLVNSELFDAIETAAVTKTVIVNETVSITVDGKPVDDIIKTDTVEKLDEAEPENAGYSSRWVLEISENEYQELPAGTPLVPHGKYVSLDTALYDVQVVTDYVSGFYLILVRNIEGGTQYTGFKFDGNVMPVVVHDEFPAGETNYANVAGAWVVNAEDYDYGLGADDFREYITTIDDAGYQPNKIDVGYNVNGVYVETNKVDIADAYSAYRASTAHEGGLADILIMLASDVDGSLHVTNCDANEILKHYKNITTGN